MERIDLHLAAGKSQQTAQQILAIVIGNDGYSFCVGGGNPIQFSRIYSSAWTKGEGSLSTEALFTALKKNHPELESTYKEVRIAYDSKQLSLVPTPVYSAGSDRDFFNFEYGASEQIELHRNTIKSLDVEIISAFPIGWIEMVEQHFPGAFHYAADTVMSMRLQHEKRKTAEQTIYLRLEEAGMSSWYYKADSLQAYNHRYTQSPEDVLYFTSLIANQQEVVIHYFGGNAAMNEIAELLGRYYDLVTPLVNDSSIAFDPQLNQLNALQLQVVFACLCA